MPPHMSDHYAVILAGGSGTRFWPLSRNDRPKQLLDLFGSGTLLNQTIARLEGLIPTENIFILTNQLQVETVREVAKELPPENIFAEPAKRDTAPAVALGIGLVAARNPEATMLILPADQLIKDTDAFLSQWRACLLRDINHPSIITWVPTNEVKEPDNPDMSAAKVRIYEETRALDPTRPVIDTSGYCHTKTDIVDLHVNPPDGDACRAWWEDWRRSIAETGNFPAWPDSPTYCDGFRHEGQPVIISETGNWWISEWPPEGPWEAYGIGPLPTVDAFLDRYRDFFTALMAEPECAGFSYVQLYDVEGEVNGYLTYDRRPKMPPDAIRAIHAEGLRLRALAGAK
jgi:hypothetical protein